MCWQVSWWLERLGVCDSVGSFWEMMAAGPHTAAGDSEAAGGVIGSGGLPGNGIFKQRIC